MTDSQESEPIQPSSSATPPRWQPLSAIERRVVGVLAEKAKTTPDIYPMTLNGITTGCNQKSNRYPLMQLEADDVEPALERLRSIGAVGMVEGYGRVNKYRHYLYEWLGVDKVELAVMTELLLRGAQTEGELRGRAARMEPIADLAALKPILQSLRKNLVISLTPEGRGHAVSHNLYQPRELEHLRAQFGPGRPAAAVSSAAGEAPVAAAVATSDATTAASSVSQASIEPLRREIEELRSLLRQLQDELSQLAAEHRQTDSELRHLKEMLGG